MKAFTKSNPAQVVVRHYGDANIARCGIGRSSTSASSTSDALYAADKAARKYFGQGAKIALELKQSGDWSGRPTIYVAADKRACGGCGRWHTPTCDAAQKDLCPSCAKGIARIAQLQTQNSKPTTDAASTGSAKEAAS